MLWHLKTLFKESVDLENNHLDMTCCMKKAWLRMTEIWDALFRNPKGTFRWWVSCCGIKLRPYSYTIIPLASSLANVVSKWGSATKFWVLAIFKKILYPVTCKCFLVFNAILHVRRKNIIVQRWFSSQKMFLGWFLKALFLAACKTSGAIPT